MFGIETGYEVQVVFLWLKRNLITDESKQDSIDSNSNDQEVSDSDNSGDSVYSDSRLDSEDYNLEFDNVINTDD